MPTTIPIPYTFVAGTVIDPDQMNSNFQSVATNAVSDAGATLTAPTLINATINGSTLNPETVINGATINPPTTINGATVVDPTINNPTIPTTNSGNVALVNKANTFTASQTIAVTNPALNLIDASQPANAQRFDIVATAQQLQLRSLTDVPTIQATILQLTRAGDATINGHTTLQRANPELYFVDTAQAADAKVFDVVNSGQTLQVRALPDSLATPQATCLILARNGLVTVPGTLNSGDVNINKATPRVTWHDTLGTANQRRYTVLPSGSSFYIQSRNDADGFVANLLGLSQAGTVTVPGDVIEKGRTTPMGHWIDVPFSAANYVGFGGTWTVASGNVTVHSYSVVGKTLMLSVVLNGTTAGTGVTQLHILVPAGFTLARTTTIPFNFSDTGGSKVGYATAGGLTDRLQLLPTLGGGGAFNVGAVSVYLTMPLFVA